MHLLREGQLLLTPVPQPALPVNKAPGHRRAVSLRLPDQVGNFQMGLFLATEVFLSGHWPPGLGPAPGVFTPAAFVHLQGLPACLPSIFYVTF